MSKSARINIEVMKNLCTVLILIFIHNLPNNKACTFDANQETVGYKLPSKE